MNDNIHSTIIPERLDVFINKYAEHTHDKWAFEKVSWEKICTFFLVENSLGSLADFFFFFFQIQNNWTYGEMLDENAKTHPMLRPYKTFSEKVSIVIVGLSVVRVYSFDVHFQ